MIDKFLAVIIMMSTFCQISTWWAINTGVGVEINPLVTWRLSGPILFFVPTIIAYFFIINVYNWFKKTDEKHYMIFKAILFIMISIDFITDIMSTILVLK